MPFFRDAFGIHPLVDLSTAFAEDLVSDHTRGQAYKLGPTSAAIRTMGAHVVVAHRAADGTLTGVFIGAARECSAFLTDVQERLNAGQVVLDFAESGEAVREHLVSYRRLIDEALFAASNNEKGVQRR